MSNIFYPKRSVFVPASKPHADNTQYKVSIGEEDWDGELQTVIKVQMVYGGKIAGRKSPSYPYGSTDAERVSAAIKKVKEEYEQMPNIEYIPVLPSTTVSKSFFVASLLQVPSGYVTRWEDIEAFLCKALEIERIEVDNSSSWPDIDENGEEVPYWRVVGSYGYLFARADRYTLLERDELLQKEGMIIEPCGAGKKSRRVKDFKKHLFDFNNINRDFLKSVKEYKRPSI